MARLAFGAYMSQEPSDRLRDVVAYLDEVLDGMIARPSMYGTVQTLEAEFIRLLEVKEVAVGLRTMKDFTPVSNPELLLINRWLKFVGSKLPESRLGLMGLPLTWSDASLQDVAAYFAEFRALVSL